MHTSGNIRLAFFLRDLAGGGGEKSVVHLAGALSERGWDVDLVLVRHEGDYLAMVPESVRVIALDRDRLAASVGKLSSYIRKERPAVVISALDANNVVAIAAKLLGRLRTPVLAWVHSVVTEAYLRPKVARLKLVPLAIRICYRFADRLIAASNGAANDLASHLGIAAEAVRVVYNPVVSPELARLGSLPSGHPWIDARQHQVVLGVGRLEAVKNFDMLIRAFKALRDQRNAKLIILGEGSERERLECLVRDLNLTADVDLPGFVQNPYAFMQKAAVVALTSHYESFGNVLVEAMALGTPVVATRCKCGPEEILDGGRFGELVEPGDVNGMAVAIERTMSDPPSRDLLRDRGARFSTQQAAVEMEQIIHEVVGGTVGVIHKACTYNSAVSEG